MPPALIAYASLTGAILCELFGTAFLKKSEQFTHIGAALASLGFYAASFFFLSLALKTVPLGVAYAIWGGVGIVLTAIIGVVVFRQPLDVPGMIGIGLIVLGVIVLNLFSQTVSH